MRPAFGPRLRRLALPGAWVALAAVSGFAFAAVSNDEAPPPAAAHGAPFRPKAYADFARARSEEALLEMSDAVVVAEVIGTKPGPTRTFDQDVRLRAARSPALPSDDVSLRVLETLRGTVGETIVWNRTLAPGRLEIDENPAPRVGERYVLYLRRHDLFPDRWVTPLIDGRLLIEEDGTLKPYMEDGVAASLANAGVAQIEEKVK